MKTFVRFENWRMGRTWRFRRSDTCRRARRAKIEWWRSTARRKGVRAAAKAVFGLLKGFLVDSSVLGYFQPTFMMPRDSQGGYAEYPAAALTPADPRCRPTRHANAKPITNASMPMPMSVPMPMPMPNVPMQPPMYVMPTAPPMIKDTVEISIEEVARMMMRGRDEYFHHRADFWLQVSLMESDPNTKTSDVEVKGPHEVNIAAAKSLIKVFASGQVPDQVAQHAAAQRLLRFSAAASPRDLTPRDV